MIRSTTRLLFLLFGLALSQQTLHADESSANEADKPPDSIIVAAAVRKWQKAVSEIERVDVEFTRIDYDLLSEQAEIGNGRMVCERGLRHFVSVRPSNEKLDIRRKSTGGHPFDLRPCLASTAIIMRDRVMCIDEDERTVWIASRSERVQPLLESRPNSWLLKTLANFGQSMFRSEVLIPLTMSGSLILDEELERRFEITITSTNSDYVHLSMRPQFPLDKQSFSRIQVQLSRHSWLPDAVQLTDPSESNLTVCLIRNRSINDCPETTQHLRNPDLTGYEIHVTEMSDSENSTTVR